MGEIMWQEGENLKLNDIKNVFTNILNTVPVKNIPWINPKKTEPLPQSDREKLAHIAFIMDGNGRWAQRQNKPREMGHKAGAATFKKIVRYCGNIGVKCVTIYAFSTENWTRPKSEVNAIIALLNEYIKDAQDGKEENNVRYIFIGDRQVFGSDIVSRMVKLEKMTEQYDRILNIALNYGGRAEIVNAVNAAIKKGKTDITEDDISSHLYTTLSPEPDLIVRTGCEKRLSNFLMWQSAYSELYFTDVLWPDMSPQHVDEAVAEYFSRRRRYGGI